MANRSPGQRLVLESSGSRDARNPPQPSSNLSIWWPTAVGGAGLADQARPHHCLIDFEANASIDERSASWLLQRFGQGPVLVAIGTTNLPDPTQVIFCLLAVALLDLPEAIIIPGQHMIGI